MTICVNNRDVASVLTPRSRGRLDRTRRRSASARSRLGWNFKRLGLASASRLNVLVLALVTSFKVSVSLRSRLKGLVHIPGWQYGIQGLFPQYLRYAFLDFVKLLSSVRLGTKMNWSLGIKSQRSRSKVKVPASPSVRRADIHDLDAVRRVQISIVSNALRKKHFM